MASRLRRRPSLRLRLVGGLAVAGALLGQLVGPARPVAAEDVRVVEITATVAGTPEPDRRPVDLDVSLFAADPGAARPAVVLAHGFGGTKADSASTARALVQAGYTVITYTARGFGASGGRIHLNDAAYEGADARALVDFAAARPEVLTTGNDPVLGFAGVSYGGAVSLVAAGLDPRIDAVAPAFTWHDLGSALFPQYAVTAPPQTLGQVSSIARPGVFKQRWAALFFRASPDPAGPGPASPDPAGAGTGRSGGNGPAATVCGRFAPELCAGHLQTAQSGRPSPALLRLLERAGPASVLDQVRAPTLLLHGEQDTLFPLDQADANLRGLPPDTPAKMVWVAGGHDAKIDLEELLPELESWFGRYLDQDGSSPDTEFEVSVTRPTLVGQDTDDPEPRTLRVAGYPGRGSALLTRTIGLDGPEQIVLSPPGGTPTALTSLPGSGGLLGAVSTVGGYPLAVLPGQAATFTSAPLTDPDTLVGSGAVSLRVTSSGTAARLFVGLWDLGPDISAAPVGGGPAVSRPGTAVLPGAAIAPVALTGLTPGQPITIRVALPPVAHEAPVGHRWQLVVSSTDQAYALPNAVATYQIALADAALTLPQVTGTSVGAGRWDVPPALVGSVGALLLVAAGVATAAWARHRTRVVRPDLAALPLVVDGLVKVYPVRRRGRELLRPRAAAPDGGGVRAVESVSFRAEPGQVVGLLGPNGAGKTTTMRMVVGLIRPDAGTVYVRGEPVDGGAEVLGSVGALIEGPGFLPHLSGRENLQAFWAATGRPVEEAYLDESLAIAGLGRAVERQVRGYSQGMKQRLGIAQAMLGRPSLLLLDEPTNGLDPPQIKAMRSVLQDYAATGRTVVVSSHLLAEVQQTCSHVVVMHQGRVILTGSMAELTATEDVTVVELAAGSDPVAAEAVLQQAGAEVTRVGTGLRVTGGIPRPRVVEHLVRGGFAIDAIDGRRQLEEVFMSLVDPQGESRG